MGFVKRGVTGKTIETISVGEARVVIANGTTRCPYCGRRLVARYDIDQENPPLGCTRAGCDYVRGANVNDKKENNK
jgi:hypothetical protein